MITYKDQTTGWDLVDRWADSGPPEDKKAALRERIRRWLFASEWVEESFDELENQDFSYQAREKRTRLQRTQALREIWHEREFEGIKELLSRGNAGRSVGALMAGLIRGSAKSVSFVRSCLEAAEGDAKPRIEDCLRGYLYTIDAVNLAYSTLAIAIQNAGMSDLQVIAHDFRDGAPGRYTQEYLVLADGPIKTAQDLKGKVVASNAAGSAVDVVRGGGPTGRGDGAT